MDKRKTERLEYDQWVEVNFMDLKTGDIFRLFDPPDWTLVVHENKSEWICTSDAYVHNDVGTVECEER